MSKKNEDNQQVEELTNQWKRALADYQNLEKRYLRGKADFMQFANTDLIVRFLGVLDNFEKVQGYLKDDGLALAIKEFKRVLTEEGLDEIEVLGKKFDPMEMEAVEAVDGEEDGKVTEVVKKGFKLKGKMIQPAKVKVTRINKLPEVEDNSSNSN